MARSKRAWAQCELKESVGSEPWVIVRHRRGWFRVPADTQIGDVLAGVVAGWDRETGKINPAPGRINVRSSEWYEARSEAAYLQVLIDAGLVIDDRDVGGKLRH